MEASALAHAGRRGLLGRRSRTLRLKGDDRLVAMIREGNAAAFEALFDRYQPRLHSFCRHMLGSHQDAEDILQEVFVAAHTAILADRREINVRPWLYRIARNRCLNHLRRPRPGGPDGAEMDMYPDAGGASAAERVQTREEIRQIFTDVWDLPETQRTALLLREIDALSYGEISVTMDTTVPAVKSLLVRARVALAEASEARLLTCAEVRLELAEAAEGIARAGGPVRAHVRRCPTCTAFRSQLRSDRRELAALAPIGPIAALYHVIAAKLGAGVSGSAASAGGGTAGVGACSAGAAGAGAAASATATATGLGFGGAAISGSGVVGGTIAAKAAASFATAAILTAGAVEVNRFVAPPAPAAPAALTAVPHEGASAAAGVVLASAAEGRPNVVTLEQAAPADVNQNEPVQPADTGAAAQEPPPAPVTSSTTTEEVPVTEEPAEETTVPPETEPVEPVVGDVPTPVVTPAPTDPVTTEPEEPVTTPVPPDDTTAPPDDTTVPPDDTTVTPDDQGSVPPPSTTPSPVTPSNSTTTTGSSTTGTTTGTTP